jgi:dihydrofolate reductase
LRRRHPIDISWDPDRGISRVQPEENEMRKLVVTEYVSLDGVFEEPGQWSGPFFDDEAGKFKFDELFETDVQLLGRVTYEGFAAAWPTFADEVGFADRMNGMPKYVVSTTLEKAEWNNSRIIRGNVPEEVTKLKQEDGGNILVAGSGRLVETLLAHGFVDEFRFMVHPIILGQSKRLFRDGIDQTVMNLVATKPLASGVVILTYAPKRT